MKKYTDIKEWMASKPSKEETARVLKVINKSVISTTKKEVRVKASEVRKLDFLIRSMNELKIPIPLDIQSRYSGLVKEVELLKKELPVKKVKV